VSPKELALSASSGLGGDGGSLPANGQALGFGLDGGPSAGDVDD